MKIRQCASFKADLPDDMLEVRGEIVRFGGRGVASVIAEFLTVRGYIVSGPDYAGDHGWEVYVERPKRRFWIQVSDAGDTIELMMEDVSKLFGTRRWKADDAYPKFLQHLHTGLAAEPRFSAIRWYNHDYNGRKTSPGAEPLIEDGSAEARLLIGAPAPKP